MNGSEIVTAAMCGNYAALQSLIEVSPAGAAWEVRVTRSEPQGGADVNESDICSWTPLLAACDQHREACVKLLVDHGADVNKGDMDRVTPLHKACKDGHESARLLLDRGATVDSADMNGHTALHIACSKGNEACVRLLLERGADVTQGVKNGVTPLHKASQEGHAACLQLLLERAVDVDPTDKYQWTPLFAASSQGHAACLRLLLDRGADVNKPDMFGTTPLSSACKGGHQECVRLLLAHCAKDSVVRLRQCSFATAQAVGRNPFVRSLTTRAEPESDNPFARSVTTGLEVEDTKLNDKHLTLMWASPSLRSVTDAVGTYERPAGLAASRFVEGEVVHVLDTPGRWVVDRASQHRAERLRHASEGDRVLADVPFEHLTAVQPGWHEVDVALARGAGGSCVRALGPRGLGWVLRRRVDAFLG